MLYENLESWKEDLNSYHKSRKDRGFSQPVTTIVNRKDIYKKNAEFNPVLQVYNSKEKEENNIAKNKELRVQKEAIHAGHTAKYQKSFNIVNLKQQPGVPQVADKTKSVLVPSFRDYNIVTNKPVAEHLKEGVKVLKQEKVVQKTCDMSKFRDFNILSNKYNRDHESKFQKDQQVVKDKLQKKYETKRNFNPLLSTYYNANQEQAKQSAEKDFIEQRVERSKNILPPALRYREQIMFDSTKPVPKETVQLDIKKKNAKKRYELRYAIENEYHARNQEQLDRNYERAKNWVVEKKYKDDYAKGYDIINLEKTDINKTIMPFIKHHPTDFNSWDKAKLTTYAKNPPSATQTQDNYNQTS